MKKQTPGVDPGGRGWGGGPRGWDVLVEGPQNHIEK